MSGSRVSLRRRFLLAAAIVTLAAVTGCGATSTSPSAKPKTEEPLRFTDAIGSARPVPSDIAFVSLEGPFWVKSGGYLLFSDVVEQNGANAKIYRFDPGPKTFSVVEYPLTPTSTNGLAVDAQGRLLACERWNGALTRIEGTNRSTLVTSAPGTPPLTLNAPNDLVLRADGNIYFSDTTWGARPGPHAPTAVYRVAPDRTVSEVFRTEKPNGVALSPDGNVLYVGSDAQDRVFRAPVAADGTVGTPSHFVDSRQVPNGKMHVPDGICVDDLGRVYVTNNSADVSAIEVFTDQGQFLGQIPFPEPPSNCTFGGPDRRTLYVTTLHALYEVTVATPGLP